MLVGFRGDDNMLGGAGNDRMIWNNGDGTDLMEGGAGIDTAEVNGSDTAGDEFTIAPNGNRVDFDRINFGQFSLDIGTTETLVVNGLGGDDTITGAAGLDGLIRCSSTAAPATTRITGGDGDDVLAGGSGNDLLVGFRGDDNMLGGAGNDRMIWNNGDGTDLMEGGAGIDTAEVNGSDTAGDEFTIAANGDRVDFDRVNFGQFSLDIGTTETLVVNGLGGDDTITGGAGLDGLIQLQLNGGAGNDSITGGDGDDVISGRRGCRHLRVRPRGRTSSPTSRTARTRSSSPGLAGINDFGDLAGLIQDTGADVLIDFGADELTIENIQPGRSRRRRLPFRLECIVGAGHACMPGAISGAALGPGTGAARFRFGDRRRTLAHLPPGAAFRLAARRRRPHPRRRETQGGRDEVMDQAVG